MEFFEAATNDAATTAHSGPTPQAAAGALTSSAEAPSPAPDYSAAASSSGAPFANLTSVCWGVVLSGRDDGCGLGFVEGNRHFKNRFCSRCHEKGVRVPASHVRFLAQGASSNAFRNSDTPSNRSTQGSWTSTGWNAPKWFRILNHTKGCLGGKT